MIKNDNELIYHETVAFRQKCACFRIVIILPKLHQFKQRLWKLSIPTLTNYVQFIAKKT